MTVIFLHGIGAGKETFDHVTPLVPQSVALDMPGWGEEPYERAASFADLSDWLAGKIDAMGAAPAVLFGHSFGGMLALETAIRHPGKVKALISCASSPAFGGRDDSFKEQFIAARLGPLDEGLSMAELARQSTASMAGANVPAERAEAFAESMARVPEAVYRDIIRCLTTFNRRDDIGGVEQPCLCLAGSQDETAPAKTMEKMAGKMPKGEFRVIPGGHLLPVETPEAVAEEVNAFLGRIGVRERGMGGVAR
ncbi:MAG: alpha/beta fold hydrolase [Pseudomonadota bacterium]